MSLRLKQVRSQHSSISLNDNRLEDFAPILFGRRKQTGVGLPRWRRTTRMAYRLLLAGRGSKARPSFQSDNLLLNTTKQAQGAIYTGDGDTFAALSAVVQKLVRLLKSDAHSKVGMRQHWLHDMNTSHGISGPQLNRFYSAPDPIQIQLYIEQEYNIQSSFQSASFESAGYPRVESL